MKIFFPDNAKNVIGPRLKKARIDKKLTQEQLSIKLETMAVYVDRASISKIEQQKRIVTDYEMLAMAKILDVDVKWLLGIE